MKTKKLLALILAAVLTAGVFGTVASAGEAAPAYTLKCAAQTADIKLLEDLPDKIAEATGGQVALEFIEISSLGTSEDALMMCKNGAIDMYFNSIIQTAAYYPVIGQAMSIPYLTLSPEECRAAQYALLDGGYLEELYEDTVPLILACTDSQLFSFREKKVESMDDFKGMLIRSAGSLFGLMVQGTGASTVTIGMTDLYEALEKKTVDGLHTSPQMMEPNALYEVLKYTMNVELSWAGGLVMLINANSFDRLPEDLQEGVKAACKEEEDYIYSYQFENFHEKLESMQEKGLELYDVSDEFKEELYALEVPCEEEAVRVMNEQGYDGEAIMQTIHEAIGH